MAVVLVLGGLIGLLQGVVWIGGAGGEASRRRRRRRGLGVALAPFGLLSLVVGLVWLMVPDFFTGR